MTFVGHDRLRNAGSGCREGIRRDGIGNATLGVVVPCIDLDEAQVMGASAVSAVS